MKLAAYLLAVLLLSICPAAQDAAKPTPVHDKRGPEASRGLPYVGDDEQAASLKDDKTCYAIRAYLFDHPKARAPERVGMLTCVPSGPRDLKRATKKPNAELRLLH